MLQEAKDFRDECDALANILTDADDATLATVTQFKNWTIEDVIGHLHVWNFAAGLTLESREKFQPFMEFAGRRLMAGKSHPEMQCEWISDNLNGVRGRKLFDAWRDYYPKLAKIYGAADPERRVAWAGPDMTVRSKIIARQMEVWAHGQEVFDILGATRKDSDRIRNICDLGVRTYSFCFRNRGDEPPQPKPFVRLTAPSGKIWQWNEPSDENFVKGAAIEFAQIVAQTRNVADTSIEIAGNSARRWMAIAQCFAGAPETPPAPGARHKVS